VIRALARDSGGGGVVATRSTGGIIATRRSLVPSALLARVVFIGLATNS
jgi:hypothetical protein